MDSTPETVDVKLPPPPTAEEMQQYSNMFDQWCAERHEMGEEKYGTNTWFGNDTYTMMLEEVADLANYARYTFMKISILAKMDEDIRKGVKSHVDQLGPKGFGPLGSKTDEE